MSLTYKGWIPNVLGNLSFKLIGHSGHPFPFTSSVKEDKDKLLLYCIQKRIPNDYQIPVPVSGKLYLYISSFIARLFRKENIESAYIMLSSGQHDETGTVQTISGTIYHILKKTQSAQKKSFNTILSHKKNSDDNKFKELLEQEAFFICDISINRQGICELTARKADESKYSSDPVENKKTIKALIDQSYYFIKDAFHSHKHHNHSEDSLISTHLIDDSADSWSDKTLKNLYRYILHQRSLLNREILGIFCYIRTFEQIINLETKETQKNLFDRTISLEQLENSVKTAIEAKEKKVEFKCFPDVLYGYNVYDKIKGAPNFTIHELLYSETASENKLSNIPTKDELKKLILLARKVLQPIRNKFGRVIVTSGYRSILLCKLVGSNKNSNHIRGEAADFFVPGVKLIIILRWIVRNLEYRELILEGSREKVKDHHPTIIHCAYRTNGNIKKLKHPITFKPTNLNEIEKYFREGQDGR